MEISEFKCMTCGTAITKGEYDTFGVCDACYDANHKKQTASGSAGNMTKEYTHFMYFNGRTVCGISDVTIKGSYSIEGVNCPKCLSPTTSSGSVAAPKEEIVRVLRVAKRFVSEGADMLIDTDNQEAQSEFRAAEKECQRLITKLTDGEKRERDEYEKNINEMVNRIFDAERKEKEYLKSLQSENTALREALKELLPIAERLQRMYKDPTSLLASYEQQDKAIIEKARKLLSK